MPRVSLHATHLSWALVRIVYHAAIVWLLADLWPWRASAFAAHPEVGAVLLPLGLAVNLMLVLGLLTRPLLVVNVVLLRVVFFFCQDPYTVDDIVQVFSLVLALAPPPRALSLDSARTGTSEPWAPLPRYFVLLVYVALCVLYEDSVYYKLHSQVWRSGAAFWIGAALPFMAWHPLPAFLEIGWLMRMATYTALAYELLFPLVVVRALRAPLLVVGFVLHLGSAWFYPLPQFAVVMIGLLCLFVPVDRLASPGAVLSSVPDDPRSWTARLAYALAATLVVGQLWLHFEPSRNPLSWLTGAQLWSIFVDWHFLQPAPLYRFAAITGEGEVPIPSFDEQSRPTVRDRYWKCLGWSIRAGATQEMMSRYLIGWFAKERRPLGPVRVYCKDVSVRTLDLDFTVDDEVRARPWTPCAVLSFERGKAGRP
jgi:hypothetical protein